MVYSAYIIDCVRTAAGKNKGSLSKRHPADLGGEVIDSLLTRSGIPPNSVDDVILGCVMQFGAQAGNLGRMAVLSSRLPISVPGTTCDRQCGSSQQALHFAAQAVMSGTQDVVIAGGVEVMSLVPMGANVMDGLLKKRGLPQGPVINERFRTTFSQFTGAELLAKKSNISREELDQFGIKSHAKAVKASDNGYFKNEIIPTQGINIKTGESIIFKQDEGIRRGSLYERVSSLKTLRKGGRITAATSSQISDGASGVLIVNEKGLKKYNLKPRAKIIGLTVIGSDPIIMLEGPVFATRKVLKQVGLSIKDIDLYEVNEAFASVPLHWVNCLGADINKLNINGGAIALGHPLGATGTKLMTTLINSLERKNKRYGLLAICEGAGTANATIIEIVDSIKSNL